VTTPAQPVTAQYATGSIRRQLERALLAAGKDLTALAPADLAMLEDFHTLGRFATAALVAAAGIGPHDRVLDAGTGIGGTARFVADAIGAQVTAVDLTPEYCDAAEWLTGLVGLAGRVTVSCADVCALPFPDASFDVVVSQHVQMNIADKAGLYGEVRRVLAPGGRLALWDVVAGTGEPLTFPVPWADDPTSSHLVSSSELRTLVGAAGLTAVSWDDDATAPTVEALRGFLAAPPQPLGLHVFVPDFAVKVANLVENLAQDRARLVRAVLVADS